MVVVALAVIAAFAVVGVVVDCELFGANTPASHTATVGSCNSWW